MKPYVIYSLRCAGFLACKGHILIAVQKNKEDETKNVFLFRKTDRLIDDKNYFEKNKHTIIKNIEGV